LRLVSGLALLLLAGACGGGKVFHLAGTIERTILEITAPISETVVEIPVERGARVAAGDVIVRLDSQVAEAELRAFEAALAAAQATLTETEREFNRTAELSRRRVASAQQLDKARRARDEAVALVAEKEARIAQATKRLDDLTLRSHAAGLLDQLPFEEGERVPAGAVVAVVQTDEEPWVRIWLPSRAVARATSEARAEVRVEGLDGELEGRLEEVAREPEFTPHFALTERESAHLVYRARIVLTNAPEALRAGLPAQVKLILPGQKTG
jgi:HlyD family secretion protein